VCNLASWPLKNSKAATLADFAMTEAELAARLSEFNPVRWTICKACCQTRSRCSSCMATRMSSCRMMTTRALKERYEAGGGSITVKIIPGEGHKVSPAFFECQELVDFIVANTAQ
jgi:hypothetical protein